MVDSSFERSWKSNGVLSKRPYKISIGTKLLITNYVQYFQLNETCALYTCSKT